MKTLVRNRISELEKDDKTGLTICLGVPACSSSTHAHFLLDGSMGWTLLENSRPAEARLYWSDFIKQVRVDSLKFVRGHKRSD